VLQLAPQPPLSEGNIPLWSLFVIIYHHHHRHQYMLTYIELYCDVRLFTDCLTVYILYYMYILMIRPSMYCTDVRLSCYNKCILLSLLLLLLLLYIFFFLIFFYHYFFIIIIIIIISPVRAPGL